ncbi:putative zinc-binding metallopeptidase [Mucilaginibacter sp. AW1-7]|uniref:zinc-binding metallopeptidase family protein n=1 Tax=Mucilaginibacter sp. AW1-7 TaxID=3349874 RepID=UPI003F738322
MKLFKCTNCGQLLYFENSICECCKSPLGFIPGDLNLATLVQDNNAVYRLHSNKKPLLGGLMSNKKQLFKYCKNHEFDVCNWLIPTDSPNIFCRACELNHIVPNLADPDHLRQWRLIEFAKHRLIYTLLQMKLPLVSKIQDAVKGLSFDFLTEADAAQQVLTGHEDGLITLNVDEADDDKRELSRKQMNEPYRTLLGHFRHEVGHYHWDRLIDNSAFIDEYRQLFGDERQDYTQALERNYSQGPPADWNLNFISTYASSHPWEDWAETWAHYLHIMDTLETADAFGMTVSPRLADKKSNLKAIINVSPYQQESFETLLNLWLPLTFAMNSMNRSMGNKDLYPFVIPPKVVEKLAFIHKVCYASRVN